MKGKMITAVVATALIVGVSAMNVSALGWGHGGPMMGYGMMQGGAYDANVSQQFLDETKDLKIRIAADQAEFNALMAGSNPDSKRIRELSQSIAADRLELRNKYRTAGYGGGNPRGNHMMGSGMMYSGYNCW